MSKPRRKPIQGLNIKPKETKRQLVDFIRREVKAAGFKRAVVGLSGGLDSSVVCSLAKAALGANNIRAIIMPYKTTTSQDLAHAHLVARTLNIKSKIIDITGPVDAYFKKVPTRDRVRRGNMMARVRMAILYDQSKDFSALVLGTGNKSEILLGYCTLYGDTACAINPLAGLYKTRIFQLARELKVPGAVITKIPSAGLWPGQSDEKELGAAYKEVDKLLYYLVDKAYNKSRLKKLGFSERFIHRITARVRESTFKRRLPLVPGKLS